MSWFIAKLLYERLILRNKGDLSMQLEGKIAVITGGASGIGKGTALAMARRGVGVILADVNGRRLEETRAELAALGGRVLTVHCDVAKEPEVQHLAQVARSEMGRVDILMNNAGVVLRGALEQISMTDWEWSFGINVLGVIHGIRAFLPQMVARGSGYIINTASIAGLVALTGEGAPYIASKFAVVRLSEALALYARPKGIGVSVLCPGGVETNLHETERVVGMTPESEAAEAACATIFHSVLMTPEQIGEVVVDAVRQNRFFILPDSQQQAIILKRAQDTNAFLERRLAGYPVSENPYPPGVSEPFRA
jgi:NAD(P)-dependent dehydrogenase (short-subunit alcohol dehydrogenase family)